MKYRFVIRSLIDEKEGIVQAELANDVNECLQLVQLLFEIRQMKKIIFLCG